jgi:hypothetical protein
VSSQPIVLGDASRSSLRKLTHMVSGFTQPTVGLIALGVVGLAMPSWMLTILWIVFVTSLVAIGQSFCRYVARKQTERWCRINGLTDPRWKRRGGFVSWGWSIWSFCEILPCDFDDKAGTTYEVLIDVCAPVFGFVVYSRVMRSVNEEFREYS